MQAGARALWPYAAAMALVVLASNIGVQHPVSAFGLGETLTYGALTYPLAFLVVDLCNRRFGARATRRVVAVGFACAVALSLVFATPRIALASGAAFLAANLLDVAVFDRLRAASWWLPPLVSSTLSSALDTALFFSLAFAGDPEMSTPVTLAGASAPLWVKLALADFGVKLALALLCLAPYRFAVAREPAAEARAA